MSTEILTREVVEAAYVTALFKLEEIVSVPGSMQSKNVNDGRKQIEKFWNKFVENENNRENNRDPALHVITLAKSISDWHESVM